MSVFQKVRNNKVIFQNTGYLSIIEIIRLAMPFIALPYVIRIIGIDKYGIAVFAQTIVSYFSIFINWGLDITAVRDVSVSRKNRDKLNIIVSTVLILKSVLFVLASLFFLLCICFNDFLLQHKFIFIFAFINCISDIIFPTWFYQGIEKMKYLTLIRTTSIFFYVITIFIFIKSVSDYEKVVLLQSLGNIFAGLISLYLLLVVERIKLVLPTFKLLKKAFISSSPFFISRLSVLLNATMAKTVSGICFSMQIVSAFDIAQKIATVALIPMQMLNQAVYPHIAKTLNIIFVRKFFILNTLLSVGVAFLMFLLSPLAIHYFVGETLQETVILSKILSLWVLLGGITTYLGTPVLVAFGYPKPFNYSVLCSTGVLLLLYLLFYKCHILTIYNFAFASVFSEVVIFFYRMYYCFGYKILKF
ncbi:oligosaccharide flippase family protein [Bacteroides fluxus]|uniref:oligosaccharide flippase family protein n=1 Tax=Bacteroides fluxus TaxID=626930 RepID=UPI0023A7A14A|nr:oligosaccharide flippase family protein [Bacteroides fluxus]